MAEQEYVLGTDQDEIARLRRQHELWAPQARDIWKRAGFSRKGKYLDLGCGPGFTTMELAQSLGEDAHITGVDISERFLKTLEERAKAERPRFQISTHQSLIEDLDLSEKDYDGAYCRWLMIFAPDVPRALRAVARHLKPGAVFALQEYVAYETMQICPEVPIMDKVLTAIFKSWKDQGGHPNRGRELPNLLVQNGFRVRELRPLSRIAQPHEELWQWPEGFFSNFLPKLVKHRYLTESEKKEFEEAWAQARQTPGAFFLSPLMIDVIAEKI